MLSPLFRKPTGPYKKVTPSSRKLFLSRNYREMSPFQSDDSMTGRLWKYQEGYTRNVLLKAV